MEQEEPSLNDLDISQVKLPKIKILSKTPIPSYPPNYQQQSQQSQQSQPSQQSQQSQQLVKVKVQPLKKGIDNVYDETFLTNKRIICKFHYIIMMYDNTDYSNDDTFLSLKPDDKFQINDGSENKNENEPENDEFDGFDGRGYINININSDIKGKGNMTGIDLMFKDDTTNNDFLVPIISSLQKDWHKQILGITIDYNTTQKYYNPSVIKSRFPTILAGMKKHIGKNIISNNDENFFQMEHSIVTVEVSFHLIKEIHNLYDFNVNFSYVRHLISNKLNSYYHQFEECDVPCKLFPYCKDEPDKLDPELGLVYIVKPKLFLVPLTDSTKFIKEW